MIGHNISQKAETKNNSWIRPKNVNVCIPADAKWSN